MTYFSTEATGSARMRVERGNAMTVVRLAEGFTATPLIGERLNINVVTLAPGAVAPVHAHDEEQMGSIVRGTAEFSDGERTWILEAGDVYHAPPGAPHGARALDGEVVIIDVFSPPRAGLRELVEAARTPATLPGAEVEN